MEPSAISPAVAAMPFVLQPRHLLTCVVAGNANREQQRVIDYLRTENAILREKLGRRRIRLNDDHRRRLAATDRAQGCKLLAIVATLVSPVTGLRSHRQGFRLSGGRSRVVSLTDLPLLRIRFGYRKGDQLGLKAAEMWADVQARRAGILGLGSRLVA
jgi:hypothetical protein